MSDTKPAYEIRNGQGTAFVNKSKTEDWHPKYTGKCKVNEVLHFFSINPKTSPSGNDYMEFKLGKPVTNTPTPAAQNYNAPDF